MVFGLFEGETEQVKQDKAFWQRAYERGLINEIQLHDEMVKMGVDKERLRKVF